MPKGSYDREEIYNRAKGQVVTKFICNFQGCRKEFAKSTSLIVHYWRHFDVRPFHCNVCDRSFTQSGTLSRHNRAVHKLISSVSLTQEQIYQNLTDQNWKPVESEEEKVVPDKSNS